MCLINGRMCDIKLSKFEGGKFSETMATRPLQADCVMEPSKRKSYIRECKLEVVKLYHIIPDSKMIFSEHKNHGTSLSPSALSPR